MAEKEYIEREALPQKKERGFFLDDDFNAGWNACLSNIESIPAADVLPCDEGIKLGAELAAMHGATPEQQQLEEAYLKGVEYGMTRRDVRPVVKAHWYWDKDGMDWGIGAWRCSACKAMSPMWWNADRGSPMHKSGHYFCPNCGADMREES